MMIAKYDAALNFGEAALTASACPDVLDLDKGQPDRMAVNVIVTADAVGGTSVVFNVEGSKDNSTYTVVSSSKAVAVADLKVGTNVSVPIPQGWDYKYMKVTFTKSGSFTAGKVKAAIDVYQGV